MRWNYDVLQGTIDMVTNKYVLYKEKSTHYLKLFKNQVRTSGLTLFKSIGQELHEDILFSLERVEWKNEYSFLLSPTFITFLISYEYVPLIVVSTKCLKLEQHALIP